MTALALLNLVILGSLLGLARHVTAQQQALQFEVGRNLPSECDQLRFGTVAGVFCPDLRYLVNGQELLDTGLQWATNYLSSNQDLKNITVHSMSRESSYPGSLVLLLNENEVWRVSSPAGQTSVDIVRVMTLPI